MGQAKKRRDRKSARFDELNEQLQSIGVDTNKFGFYDQPAFLAREQDDRFFLEKYAEWVISRPYDETYAAQVTDIVPRLSQLVYAEFQEQGFQGGCVAASGIFTRILDRLGIWSFAVAGSLVLDYQNGFIRRTLHSVDDPDFEGASLGHAWIIAPPYDVIDPTISLQHWEEGGIAEYLPPYILARNAKIFRPTVEDVVSRVVQRRYELNDGRKDSRLHYRLEPRLAELGRIFPAKEINLEDLSLRYTPAAVKQTDVPLEQINELGNRGRPAIDFWRERVRPEFGIKT